jgi:hypothetical protein
MKGTPKKEPITLDVSAAVKQANELTGMTAQQERPEDEATKYVNVRFKETDYMRLKKLFGSHGVNITDACRKAAFHLADLLDAGVYDLNQGGFFDKRRGVP